MTATTEALGCAGVGRRFGDIVANRDVSLSVRRGSAHALIGENGAGKSTLMKILCGLERADEGIVRWDGERIERPSIEQSLARGIGMVHQHFMLVPTLTVAENVVLGREPRRGPALDLRRAEDELARLATKYRLDVDPRRLVSSLSVGEAQRVEILKVLYRGARTLILDEPTAMLTPPEVDQLIAMLRDLVVAGDTVLVVTHKLGEVLALADEVTVMRRGEVVANRPTVGLSMGELGQQLVGRAIAPLPPRTHATSAETLLELADIGSERRSDRITLHDIALRVRAGEIVGIAGVEGNGQRELAAIAAGLDTASTGRVLLRGEDVTASDIAERHARGLAFVPEDRHAEGLLLDFSLWENLALATANDAGFLTPETALREQMRVAIGDLDVRPANAGAIARGLSGGNQQKVVMLRELSRQPRVLVCAQPTRGVDIGAIADIHARLLALADSGAAILLFSAELDEILTLADRVHVMYRGALVAEHSLRGLSDEARAALRARIGCSMLGVTEQASS